VTSDQQIEVSFYLKGAYMKAGEGLYRREYSGRTRGNGFELNK